MDLFDEDDVAEIKDRVGSLPAGAQVIVRFVVAKSSNPLFEVEYRGRRASVHQSYLNLIGKWKSDDHNQKGKAKAK